MNPKADEEVNCEQVQKMHLLDYHIEKLASLTKEQREEIRELKITFKGGGSITCITED